MFRQKVLSQVAYSKNVKKDLGKEAALKLARMNSGAILIAPLYAEVPQGLKLLEVKELAGGPAVLPSAGIDEYPLSRYLNIYIAREPGREIEESLSDFLTFILSRQGQELVAETGLTPLTVDEVLAQRGKLL
jgi:phosphate transport system substrate-binding protein